MSAESDELKKTEAPPAPTTGLDQHDAVASTSTTRRRAQMIRRVSAPTRRFLADLRSFQGLMLLACLVLRAVPVSIVPATGVDNGWVTTLNLARQDHFRFGHDLFFTYGPWGFLNSPLAVSSINLITGVAFAVFALTVAWFALRSTMVRFMRLDWAAIAATVVIVLTTPLGGPSSVLLVGVALLVMDFVGRVDDLPRSWVPAFSAACAALSLQIKFSEGLFLTLVVALGCAFAPTRRLRRVAEAVVAYLVVTVVAWVLVGQSLTDLPNWFEKSVEISRAYPEAMATDYPPRVLSYLLIIAVIVTIIVYVARMSKTYPRRQTLGILAVTAVVIYLAFRESTDRRGYGHEVYFYLWAIPALTWFIALARSKTFRYALLIVAVALAYSGVDVSPDKVRVRWAEALEVPLDSSYQSDLLLNARSVAQTKYNVPLEMRLALAGHPMAVDGYESTLPWAYAFDWRPAPLFQSYFAFNADLDSINANWLRDSPSSQMILRPPDTAIDGRNSLWDPPEYVLAEMCNLKVVSSSNDWLLLQKARSRCGEPTPASSLKVRAGQLVSVPVAGPSQLVTMSFSADPPSLLDTVGRTLNKPFTELRVTTDSASYRLPRQLAKDPLIVSVPAAVGWPPGFGGDISYRQVSFNEAGTVQFSVIDVS